MQNKMKLDAEIFDADLNENRCKFARQPPIYPKNRLVFESKTKGGKIRWKYASFSYQLKRIKNWPTDSRIEDFLAS